MIVDKNTKIGLNNFIVELHDYQIEWEQNAKETIEYFKNIFGDLIVDVEHIGSTSIKSIKAKPIIDLVVGVNDFNNLDNIMEKMKSNGLTYCPKRDSPESRMFVIGDLNGILTHIIHLAKYNGNEWNNKINFRDYMNNNIAKAKEYEKVKIKSMENNENNVPNYHKNKEQFVLENIKEANNLKMTIKKINLGFMVSHVGSNIQAVLEAISKGKLNANPCVLISNNSNSQAIEKAKNYGLPYYHISQKIYPDIDELDEIILNTLKKHSVEYLLLLGYMKKLGKKTLQEYTGRILNIHPALLPKYGGVGMYGKYVHEAVLKNKEKITGITIHLVDNDYDTGKIINKCTVNVLENDSIESLSQRVLKKEHEFLVETLVKISNNEIIL